MSEPRLTITFEDFLGLLRAVECGPAVDLSLLDQIIALWETGLVILNLAQAAEILSVDEAQLAARLAAGRFPKAYLNSQKQWQLPLDEVIAQHETQSLTAAQK